MVTPCDRRRAEIHRDHRGALARAITVCGRASPALSVDVAQCADLGHGGEQAASVLAQVRRERDSSWVPQRRRRSGPIRAQYETRATPIMRARGCGMTGDRPGRHAADPGIGDFRQPQRPIEPTRFGVFRM